MFGRRTFRGKGALGSAAVFVLAAAIGGWPANQVRPPAPSPQVASSQVEQAPIRLLALQPPQPVTIPIKPRVNCAAVACLALTFDDGPDPRTTPQLLEALKAAGAKATFFMLGSQAQKHPDLVRRVAREGHEIGNHSWAHHDFTKLSPEQMLDDIARTQAALVAADAPAPRLFRPPYGYRNDLVTNTVPLTMTLWSIDPKDWKPHNPAQLAAAIHAQAHPGGIVVLHDIKPATAAAAPQFVTHLGQTYHLVTVSHLVGLTPDSPKSEIRGR